MLGAAGFGEDESAFVGPGFGHLFEAESKSGEEFLGLGLDGNA